MLRRIESRTAFAEAMAQRVRGETMNLDSKSLSTAASPPLLGVVFRAWSGTRWVETAVSGLDERALTGAVEGLESQLATGRSGSPPPGPSSTTVGSFSTPPRRSMRDLGTEGALTWVREVFGWVTADPVIKFGRVGLNWSEEERQYLNTAGANCYQRLDRVHAGVVSVAMENGRSEFDVLIVGGLGGQETLEPITEARVRASSEQARALLSSKAPPSGMMNVVLDPGTTGTFAHESFGHGTEADQFVRNRSYLQPLLGQTIGPESLTLVDDGSIPGAWGSIHFDDEGHPSQRTPLVDHGTFVGALHDRGTAFALGASPTGNTRRSDFLGQAFVRMTNTLVEPGDWSFEELVREARDGVILERWESGMEDPLGGQMQLKVRRGHRIENGKVTDLVSAMVLSGSVLQFLRDIRGIGKPETYETAPGFCGKGYGDLLPVGDGGPYLLSRALVGPS
ncbi:MAG: TldD/PmbA family protein [Thermoplasmata archaeon]